MKRSQSKLRTCSGPRWQRVQARVRCAEGGCPPGSGHEVVSPAWALFWPFRHDRPRFILCADHAKAKGYECPHLYTMTAEAPVDIRARQVGDE